MMSGVKMTKRGVKVAYRCETIEKEVKMIRARPLPGVSRTWVKTHLHKQDPVYARQNPHMQSLKNRAAYTSSSPLTQKHI